MTDSLFVSLRFAAVIGCALMAGLYFAFSSAIMPALSKLEPAQGILAMQSINRTILNPIFLLLFMGTAISCALLVVFWLGKLPTPDAIFMVFGAAVYLAGSLIVTVVLNVPLNDTLAALVPNAAGSADWWASYLKNWTIWNHVRTVASATAAFLFLIATTYAN
jgi:uncharacterized membrane protein